MKSVLLSVLIALFLALLSSNANSTTALSHTAGTDWGVQGTDLNDSFVKCETARIARGHVDDLCLWFAETDTLYLYSTSNDVDYTVPLINRGGWYLVRKVITNDPSTFEFPQTDGLYNNQYFSRTVPTLYHGAPVLADVGIITDLRDRYEGFRDIANCPNGLDDYYPTYTGVKRQYTPGAAFMAITEQQAIDTINQTPSPTFCTEPNIMGLSCGVTYYSAQTYRPLSALLPGTGGLTMNPIPDQTKCTIEPLMGSPARKFFYGDDIVTYFYPQFPDEIKTAPHQEWVDTTIAGDALVGSGYFSVNMLPYIFSLPTGNPDDSDGDGVLNINDAFPDDPLEWLDSDGDGVGNNSDAFPYDSGETLDSDNDGTGNNSDIAPLDPTIGGTTGGTTGGGTGTSTTTTTTTDGSTTTTGTEETTFELPSWTATGTETPYTDRTSVLTDSINSVDTSLQSAKTTISTMFTPTFGATGSASCDAGVISSQGINVSICWTDYVTYLVPIGVVILLMASFLSIRIILVG